MTIRNLSILLIVCLALASCRRLEEISTPIPTLSPTPRSTPLPALPTSAPVGSIESPIQVRLMTSASADEISALEEALEDSTGLTITIAPVERPSEALAALCARSEGFASIAWVEGLTALAAEAQGCADISLVVERNIAESLSATQSLQIITAGEAESLDSLIAASFCRVSAEDFETWIYPGILLGANSVSVARDIGEVTDFENAAESAAAIAAGDCDAGGMSQTTYAALDEAVREDLRALEPSLEVAYGLLLYPPAVTLNLRNALDAAFLALAGNADALPNIQNVLGADAIRQVEREDLASLRDAIRDAGLNLALIGR